MQKNLPETLRDKSLNKMRGISKQFDSECDAFEKMHNACDALTWLQNNPDSQMGPVKEKLDSAIAYIESYLKKGSEELEYLLAAKEQSADDLKTVVKRLKSKLKDWLNEEVKKYEKSPENWYEDNFVPEAESATA